MVDVYCSERRNGGAAEAFLRRAVGDTRVQPTRITIDKATCYPPALREVLLGAEHRSSRYLNNGLERDHGHLGQRPMRGLGSLTCADIVTRGHALIENLREGFSALTQDIPQHLRLATAWPLLAATV